MSEFSLKYPRCLKIFQKKQAYICSRFSTLVIEAGERSGSLITAREALERERMCLLFWQYLQRYSKGTNKLIAQGAKLVNDVADILDEIIRELIMNSSFAGMGIRKRNLQQTACS